MVTNFYQQAISYYADLLPYVSSTGNMLMLSHYRKEHIALSNDFLMFLKKHQTVLPSGHDYVAPYNWVLPYALIQGLEKGSLANNHADGLFAKASDRFDIHINNYIELLTRSQRL
jgi:hypothetical protein